MPEEQNNISAAPPSALMERHRFSLIWIIPLIAALAAGWLGWRSFSTHGPSITIIFASAEGIEAGKTKIKHRDADLGVVESIKPTADLQHVIVTARMNRTAELHLLKGTKFWIVRPRLSAEGVSGLGTLISGAYIEMEPGQGKSERHFTGEEEPPILAPDEPGEVYSLQATQLGGINQGSPVYFRGMQVGKVLGYDISDQDGSATVRLFVRAPHNKLVHTGTRFWNAGGMTVTQGVDGMNIKVESVQSLLAGGVEFSVPQGAEAGAIADAKTPFTLYPDALAAHDAIYTKKIHFLLHFSGSVSGLAVGSQVRMQGFQIGSVTDIHIEYDVKTMKVNVPITIALDIGRVTLVHDDMHNAEAVTDDANVYQNFRKMILHGLYAKLGLLSLLTGQKVINLDFVHDVPPGVMIEGGAYPEIPTIDPEDIESSMHTAKELLSSLQVTVSTLNKTIASPQMKQSLRLLNHTLVNLDQMTQDASISVGPLLKTLQAVALSADNAFKQVNTAVASGNGGGDLAGALRELKNAARSVRVLSDYLESHPEALLRGKPGSATQ